MGAASIPHVTHWQSRVASAAGRGGQPVTLQLCGSECPLPLSGPQLPSLEDERHGGDIFASL